MTLGKRCLILMFLTGMLLNTMGCRYLTNRYYDFRDTFDMGVGVSTENSLTGIVPPSFGVYLEATDFCHLGYLQHIGPIAEVDMRGSGAYFESRKRMGLGPWQAIHLDQNYQDGAVNYFKTPNTLWENWMKSSAQTFCGAPAKDLTYAKWAQDMKYGYFLRHRGFQYWEYVGGEFAICDPLLSHCGVYLRLGFDISEVSDFLLGWVCLDYKRDDMTPRMFEEFQHKPAPVVAEAAPVAVVATPVPGPSQDELDRLAAENKRLADELAKVQGRLRELEGGVEIELPETVLFDTGKATLRPAGEKLLADVAKQIRAKYPDYRITVEGHTDNVPVVVHKSIFKSNWELGSARALAVLHYLNDKAGLPKAYAATTYADNKPKTSNATAEGRQENRRAVIVLRAKK